MAMCGILFGETVRIIILQYFERSNSLVDIFRNKVTERYAHHGWWTVATSRRSRSDMVANVGETERERERKIKKTRTRVVPGVAEGALTVIYVAVGSLASCLIKVVSLDRGRAAKVLTRKFSRQSPRLLARVLVGFYLLSLHLREHIIGALSLPPCTSEWSRQNCQNIRDTLSGK